MPKIVILPHQDLCPDGAVLEANSGETILDVALRNGIEIEHACESLGTGAGKPFKLPGARHRRRFSG